MRLVAEKESLTLREFREWYNTESIKPGVTIRASNLFQREDMEGKKTGKYDAVLYYETVVEKDNQHMIKQAIDDTKTKPIDLGI